MKSPATRLFPDLGPPKAPIVSVPLKTKKEAERFAKQTGVILINDAFTERIVSLLLHKPNFDCVKWNLEQLLETIREIREKEEEKGKIRNYFKIPYLTFHPDPKKRNELVELFVEKLKKIGVSEAKIKEAVEILDEIHKHFDEFLTSKEETEKVKALKKALMQTALFARKLGYRPTAKDVYTLPFGPSITIVYGSRSNPSKLVAAGSSTCLLDLSKYAKEGARSFILARDSLPGGTKEVIFGLEHQVRRWSPITKLSGPQRKRDAAENMIIDYAVLYIFSRLMSNLVKERAVERRGAVKKIFNILEKKGKEITPEELRILNTAVNIAMEAIREHLKQKYPGIDRKRLQHKTNLIFSRLVRFQSFLDKLSNKFQRLVEGEPIEKIFPMFEQPWIPQGSPMDNLEMLLRNEIEKWLNKEKLSPETLVEHLSIGLAIKVPPSGVREIDPRQMAHYMLGKVPIVDIVKKRNEAEYCAGSRRIRRGW